MSLKLYRDFLRVIHKTTPKSHRESMKRELRHHFDGNSLLQSDTKIDIQKGYRLLQILKEMDLKKRVT